MLLEFVRRKFHTLTLPLAIGTVHRYSRHRARVSLLRHRDDPIAKHIGIFAAIDPRLRLGYPFCPLRDRRKYLDVAGVIRHLLFYGIGGFCWHSPWLNEVYTGQ